jgi:hypothetical protein
VSPLVDENNARGNQQTGDRRPNGELEKPRGVESTTGLFEFCGEFWRHGGAPWRPGFSIVSDNGHWRQKKISREFSYAIDPGSLVPRFDASRQAGNIG